MESTDLDMCVCVVHGFINHRNCLFSDKICECIYNHRKRYQKHLPRYIQLKNKRIKSKEEEEAQHLKLKSFKLFANKTWIFAKQKLEWLSGFLL